MTAEELRRSIIDYGKPKPGDVVALSERVLKGTVFIEEGTTLAPVRFFTGKEVQDNYWNNHKFPLTETCMDVLGIRFVHTLQLATTPIDISARAQQVFESTSFLRIKYRRRSERISYNVSMLTPSEIIENGAVTAQYAKGLSVHECGFYLLKNPLQIGAQQDIEFLLDVQSGFTTNANDVAGSDATPTPPNTTLSGAGSYMSLELLVVEKGETAI